LSHLWRGAGAGCAVQPQRAGDFIHGPQLLIDTPEEIKDQLNRANIGTINAGVYSHWHPDHTAGSRVWETLNNDWRGLPRRSRCTPVYLPAQVARDFTQWLGLAAKFSYYTWLGVVDVREVADGDSFTVSDTRITVLPLAEAYVYAFIVESAGKRVLIAMDELVGWNPPPAAHGVDLAIVPMGIPEFHPLSGVRLVPAAHPVLKVEATFRQTLEIVRQLQARQVILTHVEEPFGLSHSDLLLVAAQVREQDGLDVLFAYDTLKVDLA
jgi:phosphoribosyl 1,2-cyclic phosphate phosphodiesterase